MYASNYPYLNESLLLLFARLIHSSSAESIVGFLSSLGTIPVMEKRLVPAKAKETDKYCSISKTELVPGSVEALPYLLTRWLNLQGDIHSRYPNKVLYAALTKLLTFLCSSAAGVEVLRGLQCQGYIVEQSVGKSNKRVTRSQTAASGVRPEPQYTSMPLPAKILQLCVQQWREWAEADAEQRREEAKRAKRLAKLHGDGGDDAEDDFDEDDEDFDEDDDFLDDDDDEDDDAFIARMRGGGAGGKGGPSPFAAASDYPDLGGPASKHVMRLDQLLDGTDEVDEFLEEVDDEVYPESLTDPIAKIEVGPFLQAYVKELAAANGGAILRDTARFLNEKDQKTLQTLLETPTPTPATPKK